MHDWNHDGKIDLLDGFIQDEIESRNERTGAGGGGQAVDPAAVASLSF